MALLKHILDICLEGQENQEKPHSEWSAVGIEVRTEHLSQRNQQRYRYRYRYVSSLVNAEIHLLFSGILNC
jgi:hypothetical protein